MNATLTTPRPTPDSASRGERYVLWIDGVGGYLLVCGDRLRIGGPDDEGSGVDLPLLAPLSRRHATITAAGEGHVLIAHGPCRVDERDVADAAPLSDGNELALGGPVRLRFRRPSPLSSTCRLDFESGHRPGWSCDAALLVPDTLLLGPGVGNHVVCPEWPEAVILFRRNGVLHTRSRLELRAGDEVVTADAPLPIGVPIGGTDVSFRLERRPSDGPDGRSRR